MFSHRTNWKLTPNQISLRLDEMRKDGIEVIDLTESNPTHCGFQYPTESLLSALAHPQNRIYEPSPKGLTSAREVIAEYYQKKGSAVDPDRILLTASTSEAYSFLFRLLADKDDRILVPHPGYPLFDFLAGLNDVKLNTYPLLHKAGWHIDLEALENATHPRTKTLILVSPNNPTGSFVKLRELEEINRICKRSSMAIISDEVFSDYAFEENPKRVSSLATNSATLTFTLGGISKALGLPQMKLAWIVADGPEDLLKKATERLEVILDTYLSVNTPVQQALASWFALRGVIQKEIRGRIQENLRFLQAVLRSKGGVTTPPACELLKCEGGWYAILRIPSSRTEEEWILEFLSKDGVHVHPGYFFDFEEEAYIVLSLLPPKDIFEEGIRRILARISKVG